MPFPIFVEWLIFLLGSESVFKGWQLLCVLLISFPPSKDFETYLHSFMMQRTTQQEGRVDIMAKHCIRRLAGISKKGPRGKPPTTSEIETASVSLVAIVTFYGFDPNDLQGCRI